MTPVIDGVWKEGGGGDSSLPNTDYRTLHRVGRLFRRLQISPKHFYHPCFLEVEGSGVHLSMSFMPCVKKKGKEKAFIISS